MKEVNISIVIPVFNSSSTIGATIEGCLNQDYPLDIEIIVVDDGSKDNTAQVVKKYPVKYMYQERKGPASARNTGWQASRGDAICFIDADCIPYRDWVFKLVQHYNEERGDAVTGSYAVDGCRYLLDKFIHHEIQYRHANMPLYPNSFGTYNVLIKRKVLEELGGFDTSFPSASGEDTELSYRIIKRGYGIYFEKNAFVSHRNALRLYRYLGIQFRHGYWRMRLYRKNISMVTQDKYGYWKDFIEIFLVMTIVIISFLGLSTKYEILYRLIIALFIIQFPLAVRISSLEKNALYFIFIFVTFIRAFIRVGGGVAGFIEFWILKPFFPD